MYLQPEENNETWNKKSQKRKVLKNYTISNTSWKLLFFEFSTLNRGGWNVGEKRWGKQSYLATSREDIREAHTILAYCFTDSPSSLHVYTPQSTSIACCCENIVPRFQTSSILPHLPTFPPPHPPNWSFNPLKKLFYSQCWRV